MLTESATNTLRSLLDLIYPPRCLVCGERIETGALCASCVGGMTSVLPPYCDRCGAPVAPESPVCAVCVAGLEPAYHWSQTLGLYSGPLRTAIHRLKYDGKTALAAPLGRLLARSLDDPPTPLLYPTQPAPPMGFGRRFQNAEPAQSPQQDLASALMPENFDVVVPVPLHPRKLRERGFNQAELIGAHLASERGWRLDGEGLVRLRNTHTQTALNVTDRAVNVRGAFAVRGTARYEGRSVLIVDDVLTTSATLAECARVVRDSGATRVSVVALARGV